MAMWTFIKAAPSGFVVVMGDGSIYLRSEERLMSAGVNGDEWDVVHIAKMKVGEEHLISGSKWIVKRPDIESIVFEMIDVESDVKWCIPTLMAVKRQELINVVRMFTLE